MRRLNPYSVRRKGLRTGLFLPQSSRARLALRQAKSGEVPALLRIEMLDKELTAPSRSHKTDAAFDLRSAESFTLQPGERKTVKTGCKMAFPQGSFGSVRDRSGLASKKGLHVMAGVVDSGYRGELGVVLVNHGKEPINIARNDRIAQIVPQKLKAVKPVIVEKLDATERGEKGFGASGNK